jgi:hypothetical protein
MRDSERVNAITCNVVQLQLQLRARLFYVHSEPKDVR